MHFDPQSGFVPEGGGNAPTSGRKSSRRGTPTHGGLRPSVIIVVLGVTAVLGVWIWREAAYGPQTTAADQVLSYLPDWLKDSLNIEDMDEATTVLSVSTPDDAPAGADGDADVPDAGVDDAAAAGAATENGDADEPVDTAKAEPEPAQPRKHLTIAADGPQNETESIDGTFGLTVQPPYRARRAFDKGMAKAYYGRHREAAEYFRQAVEIDPGFAEARFRLGVSLLILQNTKGAAEQHRALVLLDAPLAAELAGMLPDSFRGDR